MSDTLKLCYVKDSFAYFSKKEPTEVHGDDYDDAPYEYNSEPPCEDCDAIVAWEGPFREIKDDFNDSPFSVEQINSRAISWLRSEDWAESTVNILAGTTLDEFIKLIKSVGGKVYTEVE